MGAHGNIGYNSIMAGRNKKKTVMFWGAAAAVFLALSVVNFLVFKGVMENNRLTSYNACERTMTDFITTLRNAGTLEEAGKAFESASKILGIGTYTREGEKVFSIGTAPERLNKEMFAEDVSIQRQYLPNRGRESIVVIQRAPGPPKDSPPPLHLRRERREKSELFHVMLRADIFYWEVHQPGYWFKRRFFLTLFPVIEVLLAVAVWYITRLILKNAEFRKRIAEQKNLVVLGTAASTLAHEIKNPLSAIRLQTSILEHYAGPEISRELQIINEEIDRLSMLTQHVNDYLRDPEGNPETFDPIPQVRETAKRILGAEVMVRGEGPVSAETPDDGIRVYFDKERFRSMMENLFLNALESGSDPKDIRVEVTGKAGKIRIEVSDRGEGISEDAISRVFDPFFTTKSRGTGVGLAVIKRFVEASGGNSFIRNRNGGGVTVGFDIPEYRP